MTRPACGLVFGLLAEIVLRLTAQLKTKNADWLAWEDPFSYARD